MDTGPVDRAPRALGATQRENLAGVAAQVKVTHDLVAALAARDPAIPEDLVEAQAEQLAAVRALLGGHEVTDRHAACAAGRFADALAQQRYDRALHRGSASRAAASDVISQMLSETIATIETALPGSTAPEFRRSLVSLYAETLRHSRSIRTWSIQDLLSGPATERTPELFGMEKVASPAARAAAGE